MARAMDLVLVTAVGAIAGPLVLTYPIATLVGVGCIFALSARGEGRRAWTLALAIGTIALAASMARGARAVEGARREGAVLDRALGGPERCEIVGTIASSPTRRGDAFRAWVDVRAAACGEGRAGSALGGTRISLYVEREDGARLARGDDIEAMTEVARPERFWNPELGTPWPRLARSRVLRTGTAVAVVVRNRGAGPAAWIDRGRAHVRDRIDATFTVIAAPMARALVLGETDLDAADDQAFRDSGLSHLLAVSGMHLVLVVVGIERALAALLRRFERLAVAIDVSRGSAAIAIPIAWLYADFAGASGSALRAAWMLTVVLAARAGGRRSTAVRAIALSMLASAIVDPLVAFDLSFVLSLAATAGLVAFSTPLARFFSGERTGSGDGPGAVARALGRSIGATLAATIPCAPILATLGPTLPLGGLFANVVAVPLGEIAALPLCLIHAILAPLPGVERGCAIAASGVLVAVRAVAHAFAAIPWMSLVVPAPTALQLAASAVLVTSLALRSPRRLIVVVACATGMVAAELAARTEGAPRERLRVTMLDVGQGDALLVDLPSGEAMLIDGGGIVGSPIDVGARVIAPVLRARRRESLVAVVLSHPHPDHYGGLGTGTASVHVRELWDTGQGAGSAHRQLVGSFRRRGAAVLGPGDLCGSHRIGGATIEVLAPCPGLSPDLGINDNSMVLRVSYGARSFLFMGDAEREQEARLARERGATLASDVLKVAHHGAATSSSAIFLDAAAPKVALVSSGARNRFGHPRPEVLDALGRRGTAIFRTDTEGAISVETDGTTLAVTTAGEAASRSGFTP